MQRLPMEVWSHVASFLPFDALIPTFWALRRAGLLPFTGTTPSNALLQFCSERGVQEEEEEEPSEDLDADVHRSLQEMGFDDAAILSASRMCRGNANATLAFLLHSVHQAW